MSKNSIIGNIQNSIIFFLFLSAALLCFSCSFCSWFCGQSLCIKAICVNHLALESYYFIHHNTLSSFHKRPHTKMETNTLQLSQQGPKPSGMQKQTHLCFLYLMHRLLGSSAFIKYGRDFQLLLINIYFHIYKGNSCVILIYYLFLNWGQCFFIMKNVATSLGETKLS